MAKKYFGIFILILSLISCQPKHESQEATVENVTRNLEETRGYVLNINNENLINLAKIDPNLILVNVAEMPGNDTIIKTHFKTKYFHIPASTIYSDPDTLPSAKTIVIMSYEGKKSQQLADFLAEKGMTIYNLQDGSKGYLLWLKNKDIIKSPSNESDTLVEKPDFGC